VAGIVTGARWPAHWTDAKSPGAPPTDCDIWDLKGIFERTARLASPGAVLQADGEGWVATAGGVTAGRASALNADAPPWAGPLFGFELVIDITPRQTPRYVPLPVFPSATRDLALVLPPSLTAAAVEEEIRGGAGKLLESVRVIDEYRGPGIESGRRSLAVRLVLRSPDRTLRDAEVDDVIKRVVDRLQRNLDVTPRTG
jgi:phenylalanyl-tRNA synthetase beta chain